MASAHVWPPLGAVRCLLCAALKAVSASAPKSFDTPQLVVSRLKKRQEFLHVAASGNKMVTRTMVLQYREQSPAGLCARVGFTVSRKQGNAIARNRIRRRLKEAFRLTQAEILVPGWDVVVIGRHTAKQCPFSIIEQDMRYALGKLARLSPGA